MYHNNFAKVIIFFDMTSFFKKISFCLFKKKLYLCRMKYIFSQHAEEQLVRRGIDRDLVMAVIENYEEAVEDDEQDVVVYQSIIKEMGQLFLLRVFVNKNKQPMVIVTLYKTTKISKYYEGEIR